MQKAAVSQFRRQPVRDRLSREPLSGHPLLFCNAQRNRLKVLVWDASGPWVYAKRLEKGRFTWPQRCAGKVVLSREEFSLYVRWDRSGQNQAQAVVSESSTRRPRCRMSPNPVLSFFHPRTIWIRQSSLHFRQRRIGSRGCRLLIVLGLHLP